LTLEFERKNLFIFFFVFQEFKAGDHSHPRSKEILDEAKHISDVLVKHGHEYDSSWITRPLREEETIASALCSHSERLAIAYHFVQQQNPTFIQITKNLRMCGDCRKLLFDVFLSSSLTYASIFLDRATKLIAKIWQCKIIVRDANCIHHFSTDGTCSCQDHF
jgi:hypothetical protein